MVVRQCPRLPASFSGTLGYQNQFHRITRSLDLSRKGCRIESHFPATAGMNVDLLLYLSEDETPILIQRAIVRWSSAHGIGIEFQSVAAHHQKRLDRTLQRLYTKVGQA
jgi:hypothetical protein